MLIRVSYRMSSCFRTEYGHYFIMVQVLCTVKFLEKVEQCIIMDWIELVCYRINFFNVNINHLYQHVNDKLEYKRMSQNYSVK